MTPKVGDHVHWTSNIGVSHGEVSEVRKCKDDDANGRKDYLIKLCEGLIMGWIHADEFRVIR